MPADDGPHSEHDVVQRLLEYQILMQGQMKTAIEKEKNNMEPGYLSGDANPF
jgi:hypothetical protein